MTAPGGGNGGLAWLAQRKTPIHLAPGARPFVSAILRNHKVPVTGRTATAITRGQWIRMGGDSLWAEPIDYPDAQGSLYLYSPSLRWAYSAPAFGALQLEYLQARLRSHGWQVDRIGSARSIAAPAPAPRAENR